MIKTRVRFLNELSGRVAYLEMPKGMKCKTGRFRAVALQDRVVCPGCKFACTLPAEVRGGQEFIVRKEGECFPDPLDAYWRDIANTYASEITGGYYHG